VRDAVDSLGLARTLVDYNEWANERILATCDRVPDEAFHRPLTGAGHGSIFGQLRHVAYVQLGYLAGFEGWSNDFAHQLRTAGIHEQKFCFGRHRSALSDADPPRPAVDPAAAAPDVDGATSSARHPEGSRRPWPEPDRRL